MTILYLSAFKLTLFSLVNAHVILRYLARNVVHICALTKTRQQYGTLKAL